MQIFYKDPNSIVDYEFNWAAGPPGPYLTGNDTLVTSSFLIAGPDNLLTVGITSQTATSTTCWLSGGGAEGAVYIVTNRITSSSGRTDDWSIKVKIKQK